MSDYIADGPVSVPLVVPGIEADVNLGGLKFSYDLGMFYTPETEMLPIRLPPPFEGNA